MKCPNCSFNNASSAECCKVCGFSLQGNNPPEKEKRIPTEIEPIIEKSIEQHPIDQKMTQEKVAEEKTIEDINTPNEDHMDNALNEIFGDHSDETYNIQLSEKRVQTREDKSGYSKPIRLLALLSSVLIVLLFLFVIAWPKLKELNWFKGTSAPDTQTTIPKDTSKEPSTTEDPMNDFLDNFFADLTAKINAQSLSTYDIELSTSDIDAYESLGPILNIRKEKPELILSSGTIRTYSIDTIVMHTVDSNTVETPIRFNLTLQENEGKMMLESFSSNVLKETIDVEVEEKNTEPTKEETTETAKEDEKKEPSTTEKPKSEIPSGFKSSGTFSGGAELANLKIEGVRYGNNVTYERIVLDLVQNSNSENAPFASPYQASISANEKTITLIIQGVDSVAAIDQNLLAVKSIADIKLKHNANDSVATLTLSLKTNAAFKVFNMKEPGRIVIDYMIP